MEHERVSVPFSVQVGCFVTVQSLPLWPVAVPLTVTFPVFLECSDPSRTTVAVYVTTLSAVQLAAVTTVSTGELSVTVVDSPHSAHVNVAVAEECHLPSSMSECRRYEYAAV